MHSDKKNMKLKMEEEMEKREKEAIEHKKEMEEKTKENEELMKINKELLEEKNRISEIIKQNELENEQISKEILESRNLLELEKGKRREEEEKRREEEEKNEKLIEENNRILQQIHGREEENQRILKEIEEKKRIFEQINEENKRLEIENEKVRILTQKTEQEKERLIEEMNEMKLEKEKMEEEKKNLEIDNRKIRSEKCELEETHKMEISQMKSNIEKMKDESQNLLQQKNLLENREKELLQQIMVNGKETTNSLEEYEKTKIEIKEIREKEKQIVSSLWKEIKSLQTDLENKNLIIRELENQIAINEKKNTQSKSSSQMAFAFDYTSRAVSSITKNYMPSTSQIYNLIVGKKNTLGTLQQKETDYNILERRGSSLKSPVFVNFFLFGCFDFFNFFFQ